LPQIPCRKFTLADIMILVAFTAGGLAMARHVSLPTSRDWWYVYPMEKGSPVLAAWTVAVLALRLRTPRPAARRVFRQPGAAAGLVSVATLAVWAVIQAIEAYRNPQGYLTLIVFSGIGVGAAVLGAWLVLLVTRTVRPERGWIDRSGIAIGCGWISLMGISLWNAFLR